MKSHCFSWHLHYAHHGQMNDKVGFSFTHKSNSFIAKLYPRQIHSAELVSQNSYENLLQNL